MTTTAIKVVQLQVGAETIQAVETRDSLGPFRVELIGGETAEEWQSRYNERKAGMPAIVSRKLPTGRWSAFGREILY